MLKDNVAKMMIASSIMTLSQWVYSAQIATDPHDYAIAPEGSNIGILYTQFADHSKFFADGNEVENGPTLNTNIGLARGIHNFKINDMPVNIQSVIPFGEVRLGTADGDVSNSGVGDPLIGMSFWPYHDAEKNRTLAGSAFISFPVGQYDAKDGPVNIGENRFKLVLLGVYEAQLTEKTSFGILGEYAIFGTNDDFAGVKKKQKNQYGIQLHLNRDFSPTNSLSISYYHDFGAESNVDGIDQQDELNNSSVNLTYQTWVSKDTQVLVEYGRSIDVKNGFFEDNRVNLRLIKFF